MAKGQSTVEFMILVGVILFFFISFLVVLQSNLADKTHEALRLAVREIALTVQDEINLAIEASNGYSRSFSLPSRALNYEYSAELIGTSVYVHTLNNREATLLSGGNVTGQPLIGINVIRTVNGTIYLN